MSWEISGQSIELCNCKMLCPCFFGPEGEPDEGWCGACLGFDVQAGSSNGVDLGNTKVVFLGEWPSNFFRGGGSARLYLDENNSVDQRAVLEKIFSGKDGGHLQPLWGATIDNWLPSSTATLDINWGDTPSIVVSDVGSATMKPLRDDNGQATRVTGAAAHLGFQWDGMDLASSIGSRWTDPDLQEWDGNSGTLHEFNWTS